MVWAHPELSRLVAGDGGTLGAAGAQEASVALRAGASREACVLNRAEEMVRVEGVAELANLSSRKIELVVAQLW